MLNSRTTRTYNSCLLACVLLIPLLEEKGPMPKSSAIKFWTRKFSFGKTRLTWTLRIVFLLWLVVSIVLVLTTISHARTI